MTARVLLVEDTEATRYLYATWLRRAGYEVSEAATGAEALARVDADTALVVLDVHLPDMSGFGVCEAIKARPETAGIPVMHVSATAVDVASRATGLERGADAYLVEPVERSEYLAVVRSLIRTRAAHRSATVVAERLTRLAAAMLPVNAADNLTRLLEAAAHGASDVFGVPALAVAQTGGGLTVRVLCAGRDGATVSDSQGEPLSAEWFARNSRVVPATALPAAWAPLLERAGLPPSRWLVLPVVGAHGGIGAGLAIAVADDGDDAARQDVLRQLAEAVGVALDNLRAFTQEHTTALTLQRALLPEPLPAIPGLETAGRYLASSDVVSIGGDFYDVFRLPSGHVAVVIGDVQGHSLTATVVMAELRFSLRAYLIREIDPVAVVTGLNQMLAAYHPEFTATLTLAVLDPSLEVARIVNAGHIPPLLVRDGDARYVESDGMLLGVPDAVQEAVAVEVPPGATVVLVTDGLIERRGQSLDVGLAALQEAAAGAAGGGPQALADTLLERFGAATAEDDVAVLVVRRPPA